MTHEDIIGKLTIYSGSNILSSVLVDDSTFEGLRLTTWLFYTPIATGKNVEAVVNIWGNGVEVSKMTWNPVEVYYDGTLKLSFPNSVSPEPCVGYGCFYTPCPAPVCNFIVV